MNSNNPRPYLRPSALCALPNCHFRASSALIYYDHLVAVHAFPVDKLTETYAFDYYIVDSKTDHAKFAHVCRHCAKVVGNAPQTWNEHTPDREEERHVSDHCDVFCYKCVDCSTWFKTHIQAERHSATNHGRRNEIQSIAQYFGDKHGLKLRWETALAKLNSQTNLDFDLDQQVPQHDHRTVHQDDDDDANIRQTLEFNESEWYSLREIRGLVKKVFLVCGDWEQVGKLIQSTSISNITNACEEIKNDLFELITHKRAIHSMATLFFMCESNSWNLLLNLLQNKLIRLRLYDSNEAGHFFRKLMTTDSFREDKFQNLSIVFTTSEIANKKAEALFFVCMAARHGQGAIDLARFATNHMRYMGTDARFNQCIRYLIKTASDFLRVNGHYDVYHHLLKTVSNNFETLVNSNYGIQILQAQTYFSPTYCVSFNKLVASPEWITEKINNHYRFTDSFQTNLIQAAIGSLDQNLVCKLAVMLLEIPEHTLYTECDLLFSLLKDNIGNNIVRRIVERIGDVQVLKLISNRLSECCDYISEVNRGRIQRMKFVKVLVDLSFRRHKIAQEKMNRLHWRDLN